MVRRSSSDQQQQSNWAFNECYHSRQQQQRENDDLHMSDLAINSWLRNTEEKQTQFFFLEDKVRIETTTTLLPRHGPRRGRNYGVAFEIG